MSKELINKFLTEKIGMCWHESSGMIWICGNCKADIGWKGNNKDSISVESLNNNFFTWEGFGKLWEWAGEQEWFPYFINGEFFGHYGGTSFNFARNFINPKIATIIIAEYLGYRE